MSWRLLLPALGIIAGAAPAWATLLATTTPGGLGSNDSVSWSQLGVSQTSIFQTFSATSLLGLGISGSLAGGTGKLVTVCPATNCGWTTSGSGIAVGDSLIWTSDTNFGNGPLALSFASVAGAGAWIQADAVGAFTAQIQVFSGSTLLGSFTQTSNAAGDPVFLGALSNASNTNFTKVVYSLTACFSGCDVNNFAIDSLLLNDIVSVPEPASWLLLGGGLVLVLQARAVRKKRWQGGRGTK